MKMHMSSSTSHKDFHGKVETLVNTYKACIESHSLRQCVYNNSLREDLIKVRYTCIVNTGFYNKHFRTIHKCVITPCSSNIV